MSLQNIEKIPPHHEHLLQICYSASVANPLVTPTLAHIGRSPSSHQRVSLVAHSRVPVGPVIQFVLTWFTMALPDDAPCPRLCHIIKWPDFDGYGFNLHAEKNKSGQFIGKVDDDSPAVLAGLREGDKIIEVNFVNISNENHRQVVERIKSITNETRLLVLDEAADKWYRERKIVVKSSQSNVIFFRTTVPRPDTGTLPVPSSPDLALRSRPSFSSSTKPDDIQTNLVI